MTVSMYQASAPIFVQFLTALSEVLGKAAAHAEAKKIDPHFLLNMRIAPDMFPLIQQAAAGDQSCGQRHWPAGRRRTARSRQG